MDWNTDLIQSIAVGASGGVPLTVLLLNAIKSVRSDLETWKDKLEKKLESFSTRLQRLELAFEMTHQEKLKLQAGEIGRISSRLDKLEADLSDFRRGSL